MLSDKQKNLRGIICTLTGGLLWGFSGACGQYLMNDADFDAQSLTVLRMLTAGFILTLFNVIKNKKQAFDIFKKSNTIWRLIAFSIFGLAICQFTYMETITFSNAATATILQYIGPLFIMIFVCISSKRLPDKFEIISIIFAMIGVFLIATHGDITSLKISKECLFWGLSSAFTLMLYTLIPRKLTKSFGAVGVTGYAMLIGGLFIFLLPGKFSIPPINDIITVISLFGMIILGTVVSYTLYMQGVSDIGGIKASMIACIEPVSAAIFTVIWFNINFHIADYSGFVLIISTIFLLNYSKNN